MNKRLLKSYEDTGHFFDEMKDYHGVWEAPIAYPCVVVYNIENNPNGRDWCEYEYIYMSDFCDYT